MERFQKRLYLKKCKLSMVASSKMEIPLFGPYWPCGYRKGRETPQMEEITID
jgi:hypothetical protein